MPPRRPLHLGELDAATGQEWLADIAELLGVPASRVPHIPAVAAVLDMVVVALRVEELTAGGHTRDDALRLAAGHLGIPVETLRTRVKRWRRNAYKKGSL